MVSDVTVMGPLTMMLLMTLSFTSLNDADIGVYFFMNLKYLKEGTFSDPDIGLISLGF